MNCQQSCRRADGRLIVNPASQKSAAEINRTLVDNNFEVFHLAFTQDSLEDIFLSLTGIHQPERKDA